MSSTPPTRPKLQIHIEEDDEEEEEEEFSDNEEESGWFSYAMEYAVETGENSLNFVASTLRDSVYDTVEVVSSTLTDTDFYRNNVAYVPISPNNNKHAAAPQRANSFASSVDDDLSSINLLNEIDTVPIEDRVLACGKHNSIGTLQLTIAKTKNLFVDGIVKSGTTRPYFTVRLGPHQNWTSPVMTREVRAGAFYYGGTIDLVAHDIHTDLIVRVYQKNVLVEDHCIGQIIIPLSSLVPSLLSELHNKQQPQSGAKQCELKSWFEIFPALKPDQLKYRPASLDIAQTGMWKAKLGFVYLEVKLRLHGEISMWAGYAKEPVEKLIDAPPKPMATGDVSAITAVSDSGRGFKRNFQRVKIAFAKLFSRGAHAWPLIAFLRRVKSFADWKISFVVVLAVTFGCLIAPAYMLPINLFIVLLVGSLVGGGDPSSLEEEVTYPVWNQDIHDPDDDLGPIQKMVKLAFLMAKFDRWMGIAADAMERMIHVFSFADERVTVAALLVCGVSATALSIALYFVSFGTMCYLAFLYWLLKPENGSGKSSIGNKRKRKIAKKKQRDTDEEESSEAPNSSSRISVVKIRVGAVMSTPALAKNVFARVPTRDELGHRWIANLQRVASEPVDEQPEVPTEDEETWFREM